MPSSLTWVDHDPAARERSLRILALFHERESRDELGLGGIRDSFADQLFPGTSTIQTRLRYMLFVPWIYIRLEKHRVPPEEFAARADRVERALVTPLLDSDDQAGVFGRTAGKGLVAIARRLLVALQPRRPAAQDSSGLQTPETITFLKRSLSEISVMAGIGLFDKIFLKNQAISRKL